MTRRPNRKMTFSSLESLEDRLALSTTSAVNPLESLVAAKGGPLIGLIYTEYVNYYQAGSKGSFESAQNQTVEMVGPTVGVTVQFNRGTFASNLQNMESIGMVVTVTSPTTNSVQGFMPIWQLPAVAEDPNLGSLTPVYRPQTTTVPIPGSSVHAAATTTTPPATVMAVDAKGGLTLAEIYQEYLDYESAGGTGTFTSPQSSQVFMAGAAVGVDIHTSPANYGAVLAALEDFYGMDVTASAPQVGIIEGFLPVAMLPAVAGNGEVVGMAPVYKPTLR
jgi:hypothetical protein